MSSPALARSRRRFHLLLALALMLGSGCAPEDILLATVDGDAGVEGGLNDASDEAGPLEPGSCRSSADCEPGELCDKSSCAALLGQCTRRPVVCSADPSPVCGCDGLTYFNDCLRKSVGAIAATREECARSAIKCGGTLDAACPEPARCGKLGNLGDSCSERGQCWVLPPRCEDTFRGDFAACSGPSDQCVSACEAIASELPHVRTTRCGSSR